MDVADDTYHGRPDSRGVGRAELEPLPERIAAWPSSLRQRAVDDHDRHRRLGVARVEVAAADHRHADRPEISGARRTVDRHVARDLLRVWRRVALGGDE